MATALDSLHPVGDAESSLLARARELVPVLRERASAAEAARRVPPETVRDLRHAGLLRAATPSRWGGYEGADFDLALAVAAELGRGDMSTAWCYSVWQSHNWMAGGLSERAQADYFADGPDVLSSTASSPVSTDVEIEDEGFRVAGQWKFSSGSDYAQWFFCGVTGSPMSFMIPRSDIEVLDNWNPPGLRSTGSNDVRAKGALVPPHRSWSLMDTSLAEGPPGWVLHRKPSYRFPMWMLAYTIVAPLVGAAQGALEAFRERYAGAGSVGGPRSVRANTYPPVQIAFAEASAEVEVAQSLWRGDLRDVLTAGRRGKPLDRVARARVRRNQAYAAKLALRATTRLFEATGAHALDGDDGLQRFFRDVHAGSHHVSVPWEQTMAVYGASALGAPYAYDFSRDNVDPAMAVMP